MLSRVATLLLAFGASAWTSAAMPQANEPVEQRAIQALASQLKIAASDITVVRAEPHTWPDSSMGCGKPGTLAMQVITEGHAVMLAAQGKEYRVHVANGRALICDKPVLTRKELRRPANARGLNEAVQQAREDLAKRLGAELSQVRLLRTQSHQWPNNGLDCPRAGETIVAAPVMGYRILLDYGSRTYTYHTDLKDVRPCPAIEVR
jgi:hypothetical protein